MWNCFCSVIVLCGMKTKGREKVKPGADSQPALLEKHQGATRFNIPIRQTNRYKQYYMPSQYTYCGRVWNLIQACDVQSSDQKVYISSPPSPEVENFQTKIYYPAGDRTPDLLNQRQTCYHLSQRGEPTLNIIYYKMLLNCPSGDTQTRSRDSSTDRPAVKPQICRDFTRQTIRNFVSFYSFNSTDRKNVYLFFIF